MPLWNSLRSVHRVWNCEIFLSARRFRIFQTLLRSKSVFVEADDALDVFTTQLLQKKSDKWGSLNVSRSLPISPTDTLIEKSDVNDVKYLSTKEIDGMFQDALDVYDKSKVSLLLAECIEHRNCPSVSVLVNLLCFLSQRGDVEGINGVKTLCKDVCPDFVSMNSDFRHYLAEAIWLKGNVTKAIELFDTIYRTNPFLRRRIRLTLRYLIFEAVTNRSEAVLVSVRKFCENLFKQYKDSYPLACLWQVCFLSEWHMNQCIALELMEQNHVFCKALMNQVPCVVSVSLRNHRTDPVYRLLEILLKYDLKMQCSIVLVALFDYRYRQGDLMCCLEIYKWSTTYNLTLPTMQHEKFLKLLLGHDETSKQKQSRAPPTHRGYHLKF